MISSLFSGFEVCRIDLIVPSPYLTPSPAGYQRTFTQSSNLNFRSSYSHGHLVDGYHHPHHPHGHHLPPHPHHLQHQPPPPDLLVKLPPPSSVSPSASTNASSNGSNAAGPMHTLNPAGLMMATPAQQQQFLMQQQQPSPFTR